MVLTPLRPSGRDDHMRHPAPIPPRLKVPTGAASLLQRTPVELDAGIAEGLVEAQLEPVAGIQSEETTGNHRAPYR